MPRKEEVRDMFNNIAGSYDKLNHIMSLDIDRRWRKKAIKQVLHHGQNTTVLDLACGTGDFAIAIAQKMKSMNNLGSRVVGVDISEGMLEVMREKVKKEGLTDFISVNLGDGENLKFGTGVFDAVTIAFGIRNFEDKEKGLKEISRVLKPGGKLVILELSLPENRFMRWIYYLYFRFILPIIGGSISGVKSAYEYLPNSVRAFPKKKEFMNIISNCGFSKVKHKAFTLGICRMYVAVK